MTELNDNPQLNQLESQLLQAAQEADAQALNVSEPELTDSPAEPELKPTEEPKAPEQPENGKAEEKSPENDPKPEEKQTPYSKEKERHRRSWQELEREKAELAKQKEELEKERAELAKQSEAVQAPKEKTFDDFTADEFEQMAKDYEADGREDLARAARTRASYLREQGERKAAQTREQQTQAYVSARKQEWDSVVKENPTLSDPESPLSQRAGKYWSQLVELSKATGSIPHPRMTRFVVEFAKAKLAQESVPDILGKVEKLEAEIKRLNGEKELSGGQPTIKTNTRFEQLSPNEQERELLRAAREADALST